MGQFLESVCCAVVFCGGPGSRIRPVLGPVPKALLTLTRRPYLDGLLGLLSREGLKHAILCISPSSLAIAQVVGSGSEYGLIVRYSVDSGTVENAGALWAAMSLAAHPVLVCINGDTVVDVSLGNLVRAHLQSGAVGTLVGSVREDQPHPAAVEVSLAGWVIDIHEAEQDAGAQITVNPARLRYANSGVYALDRVRLLRDWPSQYRTGKLEEGLLRYLARGGRLFAYDNADRYLIDLGVPERLQRAQREDISMIARFFPL